jgi:hypothetical protein
MPLPFPDIGWMVQQVGVWMEAEGIPPTKADGLVAHLYGNWAMVCYMKQRKVEQTLSRWDQARPVKTGTEG